MIKRLLLALLLVPSLAFAQENRLQATNSLMAFGMPGPLAEKVAELATGNAVFSNNTPLRWNNISGTPVSILNLNASNQVTLSPDTTDNADNALVAIGGGGGGGLPVSTCNTRGACIALYGNEDPGINDGKVVIQGGNVGSTATLDFRINATGTSFRFLNSAGGEVVNIDGSGNYTSNATNGGDVIIARSGRTLSIQEATPSTACMGVATPNGTTSVSVTTSCAVTGSRVFYSRAGAVTNMGTISTTAAPSGSGFSFASTGASDTLANSVIYLIVKESA